MIHFCLKLYFRSVIHQTKRQIRHLPEKPDATSMKTCLRKRRKSNQTKPKTNNRKKLEGGGEKKGVRKTQRPGPPVEDSTLEQVDMPWKNCSPWKAHTGAGLFWRTVARGENSHWRRGKVSRKTVMSWLNPQTSSPHTAQGMGRGRAVKNEGVKLM